MSTTTGTRTRMTYVFDAYCGWCYGFGPALTRFVQEHAGAIDLDVVAGGLFVGADVARVADLPHVPQANRRIAAITGVRFGDAYEALTRDPRFVMDSEDATKAFVSLGRQAPERRLEVAEALQDAFYRDGLSLSEPGTVATVAALLGLDPDRALADLDTEATARETRAEFARARALGVTSYPTLLVHLPGGRTGRLGGPVSSAAQLGDALAAVTAGPA
ncbi:DsbA family protein [Cellulomonas iranensis]|uniref:DsbA family protein n=1 Tax=Cellulomonas iranensis TaxID=76862 RepID=UPI0015C628D4|nr:DsbA family protein [Cellulomonas iranensis]